ncbi:MAG: M20/M25/M40 family metallo-hydrolase, partial [Deltaproteobacteria bacterium]|nr:M20/M25/M40 family metallo-hydrolase [Deltaproteobacteria bacterium]
MIHPDQVKRVLQGVNPREVLDLTAGLVRINSVWDPAAGTNEQEAAEMVADWAEAQGFDYVMDQVAPGRPNVIITFQGRPGPRRLMFEAHTDVVTPGDPRAWRTDPFGAQIVGREMYGRGTNDTKGNLAAMLIALAALQRSGVELQGEIVAGVLCDEEDQMLGVQDFIQRGHADNITGAIICEPQDGLICCTQKGAIRARFTVTGRMSHGAMPLAGLNPAPALARLIDGLARLENKEIAAHGQDQLLGWPSLTPTVIKSPAAGPGQLNVMPGQAQVQVDVRTIPGQSHSQLKTDLEDLAEQTAQEVNQAYAESDRRLGLKREADLQVGVDFLTDRPATLTDRSQPVVEAVHWATKMVFGTEPEYAGVLGATDGT